MRGVVATWDEHGGYGTIWAEDGAEHFFHCTVLLDGSRTTHIGQRVTYEVVPGRLGRWEAAAVVKT